MKRIKYLLCLFFIPLISIARSVKIENTINISQTNHAVKILDQSLRQLGYNISEEKTDYTITLIIDTVNYTHESYSVNRNNKNIIITGGDGTGILYGSYYIIEKLKNGCSINNVPSVEESPLLPFRAIKFDLPWDTYRHSYSLTQHQEICKDPVFWESFLDMMCKNRFNVLTLWNLHPYIFMIKPEKFPEASPWNKDEMTEWRNLFSGIFRMAKERGIDTYIMPFNIFVPPGFSKAHNVALNNPEHHHFIKGDTSQIIKIYTRECVTQMLNEYPDLTGIGLTLGEGMGGMTPQERENWMQETIIEGMQKADRKSKLIHRIPFSGNTGSLGATSVELEKITRTGIEKEATMDCIIDPVWASMKFNWSHGHSTPKLIKVHGGKLYGTYFDPEPENYKIIWTVRNEDFFCLRWGVPGFIRDHIKNNMHNYTGGYFIGSETYIPAKDYFTVPSFEVSWNYAFERQWLFYMLWGRLLYNPSVSDSVFINEFIYRYGPDGGNLFEAFALAGKTPLQLASAFDCTWDFTLYSEGFMALNPDNKRVEFISAERMINQPPLDTSFISVKDYINALSEKKHFDSIYITPEKLSLILENDCNKALELVNGIQSDKDISLMYEISDIKTWAYLGLYYSEKLKGAIDMQTFKVKGDTSKQKESVNHFKEALNYWDKITEITEPIYNKMPLVHLSEQDGRSWKENDTLRFHWSLLRTDVIKDIETAENAVPVRKLP